MTAFFSDLSSPSQADAIAIPRVRLWCSFNGPPSSIAAQPSPHPHNGPYGTVSICRRRKLSRARSWKHVLYCKVVSVCWKKKREPDSIQPCSRSKSQNRRILRVGKKLHPPSRHLKKIRRSGREESYFSAFGLSAGRRARCMQAQGLGGTDLAGKRGCG